MSIHPTEHIVRIQTSFVPPQSYLLTKTFIQLQQLIPMDSFENVIFETIQSTESVEEVLDIPVEEEYTGGFSSYCVIA